VLPRFDSLDRKILLISLPAILNFAINPLVGAIDLFWVGRMSSALALAGQAAANQVYSSAFWMISFLPSVTTPLIAKHYAAGDERRAQDTLRQALFLAALLGAAGSAFLLLRSDLALSAVLAEGSPALEFARP
jgi:Na+-driven multidrug efflux pump